MKDGMVYFAQEEGGGPIKIGHTNTPLGSRISFLQVGNPRRINVLAAYPGDDAEERRLHRLFAKERLRGEWFSQSDRLMAYIGKLRPYVPPTRCAPIGPHDPGLLTRGSLGACMVRAGMTQARLAQELGCDQGLVSKWVRGASFPVTYQARIKALLPEWDAVRTP